jgi:hypothetical protein
VYFQDKSQLSYGLLIKWGVQDFYLKVLMDNQTRFLEQKVYFLNVKIAVIVEILKNLTEIKTLKLI